MLEKNAQKLEEMINRRIVVIKYLKYILKKLFHQIYQLVRNAIKEDIL